MEQPIPQDTNPQCTKTQSDDDRRRKGRRPLPEGIARNQRVVTFVTERDKIKLDELAIKQSASLSAVCYDLIVAGLKGQSTSRPDEKN